MDIKTYSASKDQLLSVAVPTQTRTYMPISHGQLIDLSLEGIEKSGFKVDKEYFALARKGNVANGRFTISDVADSEMQIQIGFQNSYDKSISLKWAMGVNIFICSNGCISGDMGAFKKKHQGEIQTYTPQAIAEYIKTAGEVFMRMQLERDAMKNIEVSKRICAELIGRMMIEKDFLESTQANIIKRELKSPTYNYGASNSLWELYQFTTFSMREIHPSMWMQDHIDAHRFFVEASGLIIPTSYAVTEPVVFEDLLQKSLYEEFDKAEILEPVGNMEDVPFIASNDENI